MHTQIIPKAILLAITSWQQEAGGGRRECGIFAGLPPRPADWKLAFLPDHRGHFLTAARRAAEEVGVRLLCLPGGSSREAHARKASLTESGAPPTKARIRASGTLNYFL